MSRAAIRSARLFTICSVVAAATVPARGQAYFSATGTFTSPGSFSDFHFTRPGAGPIDLRTWQANGGMNADGQVIPPGGIDSVLTLFDAGNNQVAQNDDQSTGVIDSRILMDPLPAGDYRARLTANSLGDRRFAVDLVNPAANGALTLRAASTSAATLTTLSYGGSGTASLRVEPGNSINVIDTIRGRSGELINNGGTIQAVVGRFAENGNVSIVQNAGLTRVSLDLYLSLGNSGTTSVVINGGTFNGGGTILGDAIDSVGGSFLQTGGHATFRILHLNAGVYDYNGGSFTANQLWVGAGPMRGGTFNHNVDRPVVVNQLRVSGFTASNGNGYGTYLLSAGTVTVAQDTPVGDLGRGILIQSAGVLTTGSLSIGHRQQGHGTVILQAGRITVANEMFVGKEGAGTFIQEGGSVTAPSVQLATDVPFTGSPNGRYELRGGSLTTGSLALRRTNASFVWSGGDLSTPALLVSGGTFTMASGSDRVLRVGEMTITFGRVNLNDRPAIIDYTGVSPVASVRDNLRRARGAAGAWTGQGLTSGHADANQIALAYIESADLFTSFPATFEGQEVDDTAVLVALRRYGDANWDGAVDVDDFDRLATHFGVSGTYWLNGDFDFDGIVSLNDFNLLAANFGLAATGPLVTPRDWSNLGAAVPEPAGALLAWAALVLSPPRRRGRRRRCEAPV